ncbi:MAG: hypothetical protein Q8K98_07280 [Bacteroidota bacterium]|nr:hypothetical protein [Bacteroidota bacterium]
MSHFDHYKRILQDLDRIQLHNKTFLDQLHSSLKVQAALGLDKSIDAFLKESVKMRAIYDTLPRIQNFMNSPAFDIARQATLDISRFAEITHIQEMTKQLVKLSDPWQNQLKILGFQSESLKEAQLGLQSHFARMAEMSILAERSFANLDWKTLGLNFGITADLQESLRNNILGFSDSYSALFKSFRQPEINILSFPPVVTSIPPIEFHNDASLWEAISVEEPESLEEKDVLNLEIAKETEESLERLLSKLDPSLIILWRGAKQSLQSDNPDRVRHFTSSLRELHTHVMHKLSPDHELKNWSNAPEHYDEKGNPTRRARLLYICREINHEPFTRFVKKDIDASLSFIDLFQRGTHEVQAPFSSTQLSLMQTRAEGSLRFLLEITMKAGGT